MSLESVKHHLSKFGLDDKIIYLEESIATVDEAAKQLGIAPCEVAKSLAFLVENKVIVIVVAGNCRIDNKKFKLHFSCKPKMLSAEQTLQMTSHPVGGVCPFGLLEEVDLYLDESLKQFEYVYPAAGDKQVAIKMSQDQLTSVCQPFTWTDVCKVPE